MGTKLKSWRYTVRNQLNIQLDDTLKTVWARVREATLPKYDPLDLEALLDKWCNVEY
jgi:hypothetical protein